MPNSACLPDKSEPPALAGGQFVEPSTGFGPAVADQVIEPVSRFWPPANAGGSDTNPESEPSSCKLTKRSFERVAQRAVSSRLFFVVTRSAPPGGHSSNTITISEPRAA